MRHRKAAAHALAGAAAVVLLAGCSVWPQNGRHAPIDAIVAPVSTDAATGALRGVASWYCCTAGYGEDDLVAAAGPALRVGEWRGSKVIVCAAECVTVTLRDWCGCPDGRIIDLHPRAFRVLAPLSVGLVSVTVR